MDQAMKMPPISKDMLFRAVLGVVMGRTEYRAIRKSLGSQKQVAERLGVHYHTIQRREGGKIRISREAHLAMLGLLYSEQNKNPPGN
jgi:DNA-binding transcriptional regulator YiaG